MPVTSPTAAPRKLTGAPIRKPFTEPGKNATRTTRSLSRRPLPNTSRPITTSAIAPTTKAPIRVGLACLLMSAPLLARSGSPGPGDRPWRQIPSTL